MASPQQRFSPPASGARSPGNGGDEAIWKRLREAGFDEETLKRRDKAALIAYITKLESEMYEYQHHMGILILERKELLSQYEQLKASTESSELAHKREKAAQTSALAEARKREENLKKALSIEKECVTNIEKAMRDLRAASAETVVAYESKMSEACALMESAQKKFDEAEGKLRAAESLRAEANRSQNSASINLQDVEAREDDLRRRLTSFNSECEAKEKEIQIQRQSLYDSQKILQQEQERLLEGQTLSSQREEYIFERSKELSRFEKELEEAKTNFEEESRVLKEEKSNLGLVKDALASREEAAIIRESLLDRKERELLVLQEKIASREYDENQRLKDEHQSALEKRRKELELEIEQRFLSLEEDVAAKRVALEAKESDLNYQESLIQEREIALEADLISLAGKQADLITRSNLLEDKEKSLNAFQKTMEMEMVELKKERDEINNMKLEIEKEKGTLEDKKKEIIRAHENMEATMVERDELQLLETKLKEEIDSFRAQKTDLMVEAEKLKSEKEKFELEWELIDEKRVELQKEADMVSAEREAVSKYLKNENNNIKLERENLRNQFKKDAESLSREREEFMSKMEREYSEWFNKIQKDRDDFARESFIQRKELENSIHERRKEVETYLREREEAFEQEKAKELHSINSQKETIAKDLGHVASELKRLENERAEIALDRERREREWSEIKSDVELLNAQSEKLRKQRELLHADREDISKKTQNLNKLEDLNIESEIRALSEIKAHHLKTESIHDQIEQKVADDDGMTPKSPGSPPVPTTISWIRKMIFRRSPETNDTSFEMDSSINFKKIPLRAETKSHKLLEGMRSKGMERIGKTETSSERCDMGGPLSGRKRHVGSQDHSNVPSEPIRRYQKRTRGNGSVDAEKIISNRNPTEYAKSADCMDREQNTPKLSNSRQPEFSPDEVLHTDATENGKSRGSNSSHVLNGTLAPSSNIHGTSKIEGDQQDKVPIRSEEPPTQTNESAAELFTVDVSKLTEKDVDLEDNDVKVRDERVSIEEKS